MKAAEGDGRFLALNLEDDDDEEDEEEDYDYNDDRGRRQRQSLDKQPLNSPPPSPAHHRLTSIPSSSPMAKSDLNEEVTRHHRIVEDDDLSPTPPLTPREKPNLSHFRLWGLSMFVLGRASLWYGDSMLLLLCA